MSKLIRVINNEEIELMDIRNANATFQTYDYPSDETFYNLRTQINVFDLYYANEEKDKEIERLNNIIDELEKWLEDYIKLFNQPDMLEEQTLEDLKEVLDKLKELKEGK